MNRMENPLRDIHKAFAHAEYEGFSDIHYESLDTKAMRASKTAEERAEALKKTIPSIRRPREGDFYVHAMFPQTWGSTALGHGGMGGAAVTSAYTIVLYCVYTDEYLVYFGGIYCYTIKGKSPNIEAFHEDIRNQNLAARRESGRYV